MTAPSLSSVSPTSYTANNSGQTMELFGGNFVSGDTLTFVDPQSQTYANETTTYLSSSELEATFNNADDPGTWKVEVNSSAGNSSYVSFTVAAAAVAPTLSSVSPTSYTANNSGQTMELFGSNFVSGDTLTFVDPQSQTYANETATYLSSSELEATFNNADDPGTWKVEVNSSAGNSSYVSFTVAAAAVAPTLSSVSPTSYTANNSGQTMELFGGNFVSGDTLTFVDPQSQTYANETTTYLSSSELEATFNNADDPGTWKVEVNSSAGNSSYVSFTVAAAAVAPTLSSVSPTSYTANNSGQTMELFGSNFVSGDTLTFVDPQSQTYANETATYLSSSELEATFNNADDPGTWTVEVNSDSGNSGAVSFTVAASASDLSNDIASAEAAITAQVEANIADPFHLTDDSTLVNQIANDLDPNGLNTDYVITSGFINLPGVSQGDADWDQCVALVLGLDGNLPHLTGSWIPGQQVDLNGSVNPSITPGTPIATFVDDTYPDSDSAHAAIFLGAGTENSEAGFFILDQYNTTGTTQTTLNTLSYEPAEVRFIAISQDTSSPLYYTISSSGTSNPSLSSVSPTSYTANNVGQTMELFGSNFVSGDTLTFVDPQNQTYANETTTYLSSSELETTFNNADDPGTWTVQVDSTSGNSGTVSFQVTSGGGGSDGNALAGFDISAFPGMNIMDWLKANTNLTWVGYYLLGPDRTGASWLGTRSELANGGWTIAPIYVGQQDTSAWTRTAAQGVIDADQAASELGSAGEGFAPGTVCYLDIENGLVSSNELTYADAWCAELSKDGYTPGIYAPGSDFTELNSQYPNAQAALEWVAGYENSAYYPAPGSTIFADPGLALVHPNAAASQYDVQPFDITTPYGAIGIDLDAVLGATSGSPVFVSSGQPVTVTSGQVSAGFDILSGGTAVLSGGTSLNATVSSGGTLLVLSDGLADPTTVSSGGIEIISAGGTDLGALISGGEQDVFGSASDTTVSGGSQVVSAGGTAIGTLAVGGGELDLTGPDLSGSPAGYASDATIGSGGVGFIAGTAVSTTVAGTGYLFVAQGGSASVTTIAGGAYAFVANGGTETDTTDSGGTDFVVGAASQTTIDSGSMEQVSAGGLTVSASISGGGVEELYGSASGTMVDSAGYQLVLSGGSASGTTLSNGYTFAAPGAVLSNTIDGAAGADEMGGTTVGTVIDAGSYELVLNVGSAVAATISGGGNQSVYGTVTGTTVLLAGYEFVGSGGATTGDTVSSGGYLFVDNDAIAVGTRLLSGYAFAAPGGVLSNTTDSGGGDDVAGLAVGTINSNGATEIVFAGGTTLDPLVSSGGIENIGGVASGVTVLGGGYELITTGAAVTNTALDGGFAYLAAGGSITGVTISSGTLDVASGGSIGGAVTFADGSGGMLLLNDSIHFTGLVAAFSGSDQIDLADIAYVTGTTTLAWTQSTTGLNASGTLRVSDGSNAANITLLGQYAQQSFALQSGTFGGTMVVDPPLSAATDLFPMTRMAPHTA